MELSIIIVNYNSSKKALACIESIYNSNLAGFNFEIILVDNASSELIEPELKIKYPKVIFIASEKNLGMGGGNNLGIKQAKGRYILILNPDTEIRTETIKIMLAYLKNNPKVGLVGPKILYPDGSLQYTCFRYPKLLLPFFRRTILGRLVPGYDDNYLMKNSDLNQPVVADWIMGCCLLIRGEVLDSVGLFDEQFFLYFEDTDLCKRINLAGWKVVYLPSAEIVHYHGRASAFRPWYLALFFNKQSRIHIASWIKYFLKWKFK